MLRRIDWILATLFHIPILILILNIKLVPNVIQNQVAPVVVEIIHQLPQRSIAMESVALSAPTLNKENLRPQFEQAQKETGTSSYNPLTSIEENNMDWVYNDDILMNMDMPDPFLLDDYQDYGDHLIDVEENLISPGQNQDNIHIDWLSGSTRRIQYTPSWDQYLEEELAQGAFDINISFIVSSQGYVEHIEIYDDIALNSAWKDLMINWVSRLVFEPGDEAEASLRIVVSQ